MITRPVAATTERMFEVLDATPDKDFAPDGLHLNCSVAVHLTA